MLSWLVGLLGFNFDTEAHVVNSYCILSLISLLFYENIISHRWEPLRNLLYLPIFFSIWGLFTNGGIHIIPCIFLSLTIIIGFFVGIKLNY